MKPLLSGKHAFVTGGAHGIGGAISKALYSNGATVTITGRDQDKLAKAQDLMPHSNIYELDVTDESSVTNTFDSSNRNEIVVECDNTIGMEPQISDQVMNTN